MTARQLLPLYPRAWRERYEEEFLATIGPNALHLQQTMDIVSGAIDAWLSADVRRATQSRDRAAEGGAMTSRFQMICHRAPLRISTRDSLVGAGVLLAVSLFLVIVGAAARRAGYAATAEILMTLAFPGSVAISMPFWLTKGQPWKAQAVFVGAILALLAASGYLASVT